MTVGNFFIDLWLTFRWGKWHTAKQSLYGPDGWALQWTAIDSRSDEIVYCGSKRVAEGVCAAENDRRGIKPPAKWFTDDSGHDTKLP